jgi:uncharacterized protein YgiM (DUF1202 family)
MSITTISGNNKSGLKLSTVLVYVLGVVGIALVVFLGGQIVGDLGVLKGTAGLSAGALYGTDDIYVNGQKVGATPYESKSIKPGTNKVTFKNGDRKYETSINFLPKDGQYIHTVGIFRDLGTSDTFSSGQNFWFDKESGGNTLRIISDPSGATVYIDNAQVGQTPYSSNSITEGEYDLRVEHADYESQTARINVKKGFTLNVSMKLFSTPVKPDTALFPGSLNLYDLTSANDTLVSDTQAWANAVVYWAKTRNTKEFDFFIDYKGNVYDKTGKQISSQDDMAKLKASAASANTSSPLIGAYLGRTTDGSGLTTEAKDSYQSLFGDLGTGKVKINQTATGWLRVRDTPSLAGKELTRVDSGAEFALLAEQSGWLKIQVSTNLSGWVSADYVTKE